MRFLLFYLLIIAALVSRPWAQIVTTIYPFKTIIAELVPEEINVNHLVPSYASPHTFELLPSDLKATEQAQVLFYGGAGLDDWARQISADPKIALIPLIPDSLLVQFDNHQDGSINPHFWTDPVLVQTTISAISDTLCAIFPAKADRILSKKRQFILKLEKLHADLKSKLNPYHGKSVVTSHPFFDYFLKRYGLISVSTLEEIPGKEPTPRTIQKIIRTITEQGVTLIITHKQLNDRSALMISEYTGIPLVQLNPLGSESENEGYINLIYKDAKRLIGAF